MRIQLTAVAAALALVFGNAQAQSASDVAKFQTPEYWAAPGKSDDFLNAMHAEYAYARGWTGKGVTVGVIDTGVNLSNPDLIGRIKMFYDPLNLGKNDVVGHGTHVAGIIAANKNNYGMQGVAYDAQLIVVKVTNTTAFPTSTALSGMNFAVMNGASVINWSAGVTFDSTYNKSIKEISPGMFVSSSTVFGGKNYYGLENPSAYASALGPNAIMVVAAGNSGLKYPENPATFATAVDSAGKLILGGRMIIAGNYDLGTNRIDPTSNLAGHVCKNVVGNTCKDPYKTSDFYLLAPGTNITSTYSTGYATMSGTSMAAPMITGAAAVLKQQWPYLRGEAIVQILLTTANKNLPGYNVATYGQGLLDLEKATRPVGAISVPTAGSALGTSVAIGGITVNSGTARLTSVGDIAVTDDFKRVYFTSLAPAEKSKARTLFWDPVSAGTAMVAGSNLGSAGSQLNYLSNTVDNLKLTTGTSFSNTKSYIEVEYNFGGFTAGAGNLVETGSWMGNTSSGSFGTLDGSNTNLVHLGYKQQYGAVEFSGRYSVGYSQIQHTDTEFAQLPGTSVSRGWQLQALAQVNPTTRASVGIQQPLAITQAQMSFTAPVAVNEVGDLTYQNSVVNMAAERKQIDAYGYIDTSFGRDNSVYLFANHSRNYLNQPGVSATQVGVVLQQKF